MLAYISLTNGRLKSIGRIITALLFILSEIIEFESDKIEELISRNMLEISIVERKEPFEDFFEGINFALLIRLFTSFYTFFIKLH